MADPAYHVFLSHSSKDKEFVRELYRRLTRDGVSCFLDTESIRWGDNWVRALEGAIGECEYVVFVLSPDFCNSRWAGVERTSRMARDPAKWDGKMLPLMLDACSELPTFPAFLRQIQTIDVSTNALFDENYPRICEDLGGVPGSDINFTDRTKLPPVHPLPERHRMPYHSLGDKFVGRVDSLWQLYDSLHRDSTAVLQGTGVVVGTGGLGKTQLAIEYVHRFGVAYTGGVYWVDAHRGLGTLVTQISGAAGLDVNTKAEEPEQVEQVWRGLNKLPGPSLIVLDNFPETVPLRPYLPTTGRVHTVVTTRRQDLGYTTVRLNILSSEEGIRLLNSGQRDFGDDAAALVERLGGLPLALELAKSYLNYRTELGIPELLAEMKTAGEIEVLNEFASEYRDQLPSRHEIDVIKTFQMSWNGTSAAAKQVLRAIGELAPAPVPRFLLRLILDLPEHGGIRDSLNKQLDEVARLSLVELDTNGNPIAHRLILAFIRHRNATDGASPFDECSEAIGVRMSRALDHPDGSTNQELEILVPHAEYVLATGRPTAEKSADLASRLGIHHRTLGRYTAAKDALTAALQVSQTAFEPGHPSIATSQSNLALVLKDLGQLEEARDLLQQALEADQTNFEPGHPSIARSLGNLALVLQDLGQLEEARDLFRQALAAYEMLFEPGHPSIATSQSNLALALQDLGQLEEARDLLRKALASAEKSFEPGHPSIARSQSNLAVVLQGLGELAEARDLLRNALAAHEKTFEPGHPSIAIRHSNLAIVLQDLGELEEARDLLRKALAAAEKTFEPGHPSTATRQSNLALVLQDLGQLEEARDLLRKALASNERTFEPGHPSIALSQSNLSLVLKDLGQLEEARDLLRKAYGATVKLFGPDHPRTRTIKGNLTAVEA